MGVLRLGYTRLVASYAGKHYRLAAFADFSCNLRPRKLKYVRARDHSCIDGHPQNLFVKNFKMTKPRKFLPQQFPNIRYTSIEFKVLS